MKTVSELQREKQLNITRNAHIDTLIKEIQDNCAHVWEAGDGHSVSYHIDVCYLCKKVSVT